MRTLERTATFMPMKPGASESTAPIRNPKATLQPRSLVQLPAMPMTKKTTTATPAIVVNWRSQVGGGALLDGRGDLLHAFGPGGLGEHPAGQDEAVDDGRSPRTPGRSEWHGSRANSRVGLLQSWSVDNRLDCNSASCFVQAVSCGSCSCRLSEVGSRRGAVAQMSRGAAARSSGWRRRAARRSFSLFSVNTRYDHLVADRLDVRAVLQADVVSVIRETLA